MRTNSPDGRSDDDPLWGKTAYFSNDGHHVRDRGVLLSFLWDVPTGSASVLLATAIFFLSVLFSPKRLSRASA